MAWLAITDAAGGICRNEQMPPKSMWPDVIDLAGHFSRLNTDEVCRG